MGFITGDIPEETVTITSQEERQRMIDTQVRILRSYALKITEDEWDLLEEILQDDPMSPAQFSEYLESLYARPALEGFRF